MRLLLLFCCVLLVTACSTNNGPLRLDFVGTTRFTSSNRAGAAPADTLASRVYAEANSDDPSQLLTRLRVTVKYMPRRNPFVYPVPISSLVRDSIDNRPDPDFIYLDTALTSPATAKSFVFTSVFGVRTTSGTERWQYDLLNADGSVGATRAFKVSVRRPDSLLTYHDYTLKLSVPASGPAARRFLQLRAGLALPAYSVLGLNFASVAEQAVQQRLTDLIVLPSGTQLVSPDNTTLLTLSAQRWPLARRRPTRIYLTRLAPAAYDAATTNDVITSAYTNAATGDGTATGSLAVGEVYAYRAEVGVDSNGNKQYNYGLIKVLSLPSNTTAGLQLQVRTVK